MKQKEDNSRNCLKLMLGDVVDFGGGKCTVVAVLFIGERYYLLKGKYGVLSLMPAIMFDNSA